MTNCRATDWITPRFGALYLVAHEGDGGAAEYLRLVDDDPETDTMKFYDSDGSGVRLHKNHIHCIAEVHHLAN